MPRDILSICGRAVENRLCAFLHADATHQSSMVASAGQSKGKLGYPHVNEVLLVILMVKSPKPFRSFDKKCTRYIHRFTQMTAGATQTLQHD